MPHCSRCGQAVPRVFEDDLCGCCDITVHKMLPVIGLEYATRGRVDRINPRKDTLRAVEYMANHEPKWTKAQIQRWKRQAEALPDRSTKIQDGAWDWSAGPSMHPRIQADEREGEAMIREKYNQRKYERVVLRKKATTPAEAQDYAIVDALEGPP